VRKDMEAAALAVNATLQHLELRSPNGLEAVFQEAIKGRADAVIVLQSPLVFSRPVQVQRSQLRAGCRRCTRPQNLFRPEGSWATVLT
jgi:hypothetical protein